MDVQDHKHWQLSEDLLAGDVQPCQHLCDTSACVGDADAEKK